MEYLGESNASDNIGTALLILGVSFIIGCYGFFTIIWLALINTFYYSISGSFLYGFFDSPLIIKENQVLPLFGVVGFLHLAVILIVCFVASRNKKLSSHNKIVRVLICSLLNMIPSFIFWFLAHRWLSGEPDSMFFTSPFKSLPTFLEDIVLMFFWSFALSFIPVKIFSLFHKHEKNKTSQTTNQTEQ